MRGLLFIAWVQNRRLLGWLSLTMGLLSWLLAAPMAPMRDGLMKLVADTPFLQKLVGGVLGLDLTGQVTVKLLVGSTWAHPLLLALIWGYAIASASRFPAQEIEQGTIDTLLCQPVSRWAVLAAHAVLALLGLLWLLAVGLFAFLLGCRNLGSDAPTLAEMLPVALSLFATAALVLGVTSLVAVHCRTRGKAVGVLFGLVLASLLLAYLQPFVPWAADYARFGLLEYYKPGEILRSGVWPAHRIAALLASGVAIWFMAGWRLQGRDL